MKICEDTDRGNDYSLWKGRFSGKGAVCPSLSRSPPLTGNNVGATLFAKVSTVIRIQLAVSLMYFQSGAVHLWIPSKYGQQSHLTRDFGDASAFLVFDSLPAAVETCERIF